MGAGCQQVTLLWGGGGGGVTAKSAIGGCTVPDAQELSSEKHPTRGFNGRPKDTLNSSHGPTLTS